MLLLLLVAVATTSIVPDHAVAKPFPVSTDPLSGDPDDDYGPAHGPVKAGTAKSTSLDSSAALTSSYQSAGTRTDIAYRYFRIVSLRAFLALWR